MSFILFVYAPCNTEIIELAVDVTLYSWIRSRMPSRCRSGSTSRVINQPNSTNGEKGSDVFWWFVNFGRFLVNKIRHLQAFLAGKTAWENAVLMVPLYIERDSHAHECIFAWSLPDFEFWSQIAMVSLNKNRVRYTHCPLLSQTTEEPLAHYLSKNNKKLSLWITQQVDDWSQSRQAGKIGINFCRFSFESGGRCCCC